MTLRTYLPSDLAALHTINVAGEPGVGAVSQAELGGIIGGGQCLVAVDADDVPLGFILVFLPGEVRASPNFDWFAERYERFVYVDRIAVAAAARGQQIGDALYQGTFAQFADAAPMIACEVNTEPPNPGSMRFHARLGFAEVGTAEFAPGKSVAYLARRLEQ